MYPWAHEPATAEHKNGSEPLPELRKPPSVLKPNRRPLRRYAAQAADERC